MLDRIVLFTKKSDCCGCSACMAICPQGAITMSEDEEGFLYPQINENKCVGCRLCMRVCKDGSEKI